MSFYTPLQSSQALTLKAAPSLLMAFVSNSNWIFFSLKQCQQMFSLHSFKRSKPKDQPHHCNMPCNCLMAPVKPTLEFVTTLFWKDIVTQTFCNGKG